MSEREMKLLPFFSVLCSSIPCFVLFGHLPCIVDCSAKVLYDSISKPLSDQLQNLLVYIIRKWCSDALHVLLSVFFIS